MFYDAGFYFHKFYLVVLASTSVGFIILSLTGKEKNVLSKWKNVTLFTFRTHRQVKQYLLIQTCRWGGRLEAQTHHISH